MNILVLNGSPRQNGNTAKMVTAFCEGAESSNHTVKTVNVCKLNVKGCLACEYCHSKGNGKCIQKDDMQDIYSLLKAIPHKDCASDAKSDFSLDCTKSMQAYWRMSKRFCAR